MGTNSNCYLGYCYIFSEVKTSSKDLDISKIYKRLPKKFVFPQLRTFHFRLAVWFYTVKDRLNI